MMNRLIGIAAIVVLLLGARPVSAAEYKYCALPGGGSVNYVGSNPVSIFHVWYAVMSPIDIAPNAVSIVMVTIEGARHEYVIFNNGAVSFVNMVQQPADTDLQARCPKVTLPPVR
jgi:hypothetical protein